MPLLDKLRKLYGSDRYAVNYYIAPSTYYHCQQQRHHPDKRSARAQRDDWLKKEIRAYTMESSGIRVRKVWRQLLREANQGSQMYSGASWRLWTCGVSPGKGPHYRQPESRCRRRPRKPSVCGRTSLTSCGWLIFTYVSTWQGRLCGVHH